MDIVKFTLGGKFAFFKKPDVNSYYYFTYCNIHKIALLGIFGAILGYSGYNNMSFNEKYNKENRDFPEFYDKLKELKISIVPANKSISKKVQIFNNSVGYASKELGGNLIIKEQWLEKPCWDIYIALECDEARKICKALVNNEYIYLPYLGKNDHFANITNVVIVKDVIKQDNVTNIDSLFLKDNVELSNQMPKGERIFKYEEFLPYSYEKVTNKYEFKSFIYTNALLKLGSYFMVCKVEEKNIAFF